MKRIALALSLAVLAFAFGCDNPGSGSSTPQQGGSNPTPTHSYDPAPIPLMILDSWLTLGTHGQSYSHQMTAIGGSGGYNWTIVSTGSPGMFNLTNDGMLTVTQMPQNNFTTDITIAVQDAGGDVNNHQFSFGANHPVPPPVWIPPNGETYLLHGGDEMSAIDTGQTLSRFQRAVQGIMRDIAERQRTTFYANGSEFMVIVCGHDTAASLSQTAYSDWVASKELAINALATVTPGGEAPVYSGAQLAQTVHSAFEAPTQLCLYSGGAFGADSAAPGGQADYANVLSHFSSWVPTGTIFSTEAYDFQPSGAHAQFMQDFAALTAGGTYTAP